jgi:hypothetical protein
MRIIYWSLIGFIYFLPVYADLFTSIADLQKLLAVEKNIPELINSYIATENDRLDELKK